LLEQQKNEMSLLESTVYRIKHESWEKQQQMFVKHLSMLMKLKADFKNLSITLNEGTAKINKSVEF